MMAFLKSVMRLDEDQCAREIIRKEFNELRDDYYELEVHIFFDDAFIRVDKNDNDPRLNSYVEELILAVHEATTEMYSLKIPKQHPTKYATPYGGRLEWILPGNTNMTVHLKDTKEIRAKKRWSQVMYMYYLLGFRISKNLEQKELDQIANNTYILALDGDIDFQPNAVHHLVTLMKRNMKLGAACGRIHPLGSGPMVWYQIFEYSIAHWLQKSTESMLGCVLCSPGCFSLFRAKALRDDVMTKYSFRAKQARHFVQYDQGEDRWLCTLLLQRGYKVEYCAASDSYTQCPEKFIEFYNQRRRWMPSTTANILDLLIDYEHTVKMNDDISRIYILYQTVLMVGTILGPGTIFLMLVGSFVAAFQMSQWSSFCWNAFPIILFMGICYWCNSKIQLFFAGLLSAVYGLVMMAVLIGVMLQITVDGPLAPSSLFFFGIATQMIITALLHPKEVGNLLYGIVYYVTIPSMYLLLVIYSVFNLNDVSWGTREVTTKPKKPEECAKSTKKDHSTGKNSKQNRVINIFGSEDMQKKTGSLEFSLAGLFTCMLCTHSKQEKENERLLKIFDRLDEIEALIQNKPNSNTSDSCPPAGVKVKEANLVAKPDYVSIEEEKPSLDNWMNDEAVEHGRVEYLLSDEKDFWKALVGDIDMLKPVVNVEDQDKVAKDLKDLKDKAVMAFIMLNSIFVLVVFLLTLKKDLLHVKWPLNAKVNFTYIDSTREIKIYKEYLQLEPIGFVFLFFFATILLVQFMAMLFHRVGTFTQILASTDINWSYFIQLKNIGPEQILKDNPVKQVKKLMKPEKCKELPVHRRKTVKYRGFDYPNDAEEEADNLYEEFKRNCSNVPEGSKRKPMIDAVNKRRTDAKVSAQHPESSPTSDGEAYDNEAYVN